MGFHEPALPRLSPTRLSRLEVETGYFSADHRPGTLANRHVFCFLSLPQSFARQGNILIVSLNKKEIEILQGAVRRGEPDPNFHALLLEIAHNLSKNDGLLTLHQSLLEKVHVAVFECGNPRWEALLRMLFQRGLGSTMGRNDGHKSTKDNRQATQISSVSGLCFGNGPRLETRNVQRILA